MIQFSGYELLVELYKDRRQTVWRALQTASGKTIIIRYFPFEALTQSHIVQLTYEFEQASRIESVHVGRAYSMERVRDQNFNGLVFFLEDPPGVTLKAYIAKKRIPLREVLDIAIQAAKGLRDLHMHEIIHSDINPDAICVDTKRRFAVIRDFGFSALSAYKTEMIYDPVVITRNLPYISPEQTGRTSMAIDYRTDFYSLGATLYEALTGMPPFPSTEPLEIIHAHLARQPRPPSIINENIPRAISEIVMKLLAKDPENRYLSAAGLIRDLEECLARITRNEPLESFTPGMHDTKEHFSVPRRLYGRTREREALIKAFEDASQGSLRVLAVTGEEGIGKSTLINELSDAVAKREGYLATGKCHRMSADIPYGVFIQAFQSLIRQILSENEDRLHAWRTALKSDLGPGGRIINEIIPEAEYLMGPLPPLPEAGPTEIQNRFNMAVKHFVRHFATEDHPLALVIEDIQWADSASMEMLYTLATYEELSHTLFIVTSDDASMRDESSTQKVLDKIAAAGTRVDLIRLGPLSPDDVSLLVAETLDEESDACRELADCIALKTAGNPFFITQFLRRLHENGILVHSPGGGWHWYLNRVQSLCASDNVIDLIIEAMRLLDPEQLEVLKAAAVLGSRFTAEALAGVSGKPIDRVMEIIGEAIRRELIAREGDGYAFSHDRIHETLISLFTPEELKIAHYSAARYFLSYIDAEELDERPFVAADHLNQCADLIKDGEERRNAALLNLKAGIRSKTSTAYVSALRYLEYAESFLPADAWKSDYDLAFSVQLEKAEVSYLVGSFPQNGARFTELMDKARTDIDKARVYSLLTVLQTHLHRLSDAVRTGLQGCRILGMNLPEKPGPIRVLLELMRVRLAFRSRGTQEIINLPAMEDKVKLTLLDLMQKAMVPAYFSSEPHHRILFFFMVLKIISISLRHGNSKYSAYAYLLYGAFLGVRFGDYRAAYEYGMLGISVIDKYPDPFLKGRLHQSFGALIAFWCRPFHSYIHHFTEALHLNLVSGDFLYTTLTISNLLSHSFRKGNPIDSLMLLHEAHRNVVAMSGIAEAPQMFDLYRNAIQELKEGGEASSETASSVLEHLKGSAYLHHMALLLKMISLFMKGRYREAAGVGREMERGVSTHLGSVIHITEFWFYYSLSLSSLNEFDDIQHAKRKLAQAVKRFAKWSAGCAENFSHQLYLLEGELARIDGRMSDAAARYGIAAREAKKNGYLNHEGIIAERAARFYAGLGDHVAAAAHADKARLCFREWGAEAVARRVEAEYAEYLSASIEDRLQPAARDIDYATIVNSLQAISSEIVSDELLKKLMKISLENAGAERGYFISIENGSARIIAETVTDDEVRTDIVSKPLNEVREIFIPIINYVMNARKPLIIGDTRYDEFLPLGEYPSRELPSSVICLPVIRQGKLTGVLYLENRSVRGAFTPSHLEILRLLAAQAGVSLEIATLYERLTKEISQHWRAEEALRDSEERYRILVETMNEGICALDELGNLTFVNSRFCEMIGYERDEVIGQPLARYTSVEGRRVLKQQLMRRRQGEHEPYELPLVHKNGAAIAAMVSPRPLFDSEGRFAGSFGLITDITEKKRLEEDLLKALKIESLGVFAGGIAHDFNNLLTAIIGNISLARLSVPPEDTIHAILAEAEQASLRAKDLTQQLLTFSRGGAPIKKAASISKLLTQTIDFTLRGSAIRCIYHIQEDLHNVEIDEGQISQVIQNLVINAMQAMNSVGTIEVKASNVAIDEHAMLPLAAGTYIRIDIIDRGGGIAPEHQKFIFDPYFTTKEHGSGLGLTVSYSIAKRHGGYLCFDTRPGEGTTFSLYLPASAVPTFQEDIEEKEETALTGRVLIMDDDEVICKVAGNMLSHMGMSAEFASHGEEAVERYRRALEQGKPFDIVIMDLTVPGKMGGKDAIAHLRALHPEVRAVVSSGYSNDPVMANFAAYGFRDVVSKPYRYEDLKAVVTRVLKRI